MAQTRLRPEQVRLDLPWAFSADVSTTTEFFAGNGLVGSPAYSFLSDVDTGMYRIGVNDLGLTTNSTLALELNAVQQALVTNGTVAAPGLAFISDPDTGLYRLGANRLGFATAGAFAVEIDAAGKVGIGTAAIPHGGVGWAMVALEGAAGTAAGPNMQFTIVTDDYPTMQLLNFSHDNVVIALDSYYDGAWKSSDVGSNFKIEKAGDLLYFRYDSGIAQGAAITWNDGIVLTTAGKVGIATSVIPHGAIGWAMLALDGAAGSAAGPHVQFTTVTDDWPTMQLLNFGHDNVYVGFDCYYDGTWKSSDPGSNFYIGKAADKLYFRYDSAVAAGGAIGWNDGIVLDAAGGVFMANLKRGANQGAAGAAANELWVDSADESIKRGV